jgi:hypothetical protein
VQGLFQSYIYSVGNIAAASFWISAFLIPGLSLKASNA